MTAATPPAPQEAADVLAGELLAVTSAATAPTVEALRVGIQVVVAGLVARWVLAFGSVSDAPVDTAAAAPFVDYARDVIAGLTLDPAAQEALEAAVADAWRLGGDHAAQFAPRNALRSILPTSRVLPDLTGVLAEQRSQAILGIDERALEARGFPTVVQSVAKLHRAASRIESNVAYEVTRAANDGVRDTTPPGWLVMWVAERDACLTCLAYAGQTAAPGSPFPDGLTFADRPMAAHEPLIGPPRHPHCRCVLQPLPPTDTAVPDGLKREARRSVLRGWADEDSVKAKLRAADRLLTTGARLPKTVEARARRAVRDGRFN